MSDSSRDYDSNGSRKSLRNRLQSMQSTDRTDAKKGQHLSDLTKNIGNTLQSIFSNKSDSSVYSKGVRELDNFGYEKYNLEDDGGEIFISKVPERAMFNDGEPIIVRATAGNFVGSSDNTTVRFDVGEAEAKAEDMRNLFSNVPRGTAVETEYHATVGEVTADGTVKPRPIDASFLGRMKASSAERQTAPAEDQTAPAPEASAQFLQIDEDVPVEVPDNSTEVPILKMEEAPVEEAVSEPAPADNGFSFLDRVSRSRRADFIIEPEEAEVEEPVEETPVEEAEDDYDWIFADEDQEEVMEMSAEVPEIGEVAADVPEDIVIAPIETSEEVPVADVADEIIVADVPVEVPEQVESYSGFVEEPVEEAPAVGLVEVEPVIEAPVEEPAEVSVPEEPVEMVPEEVPVEDAPMEMPAEVPEVIAEAESPAEAAPVEEPIAVMTLPGIREVEPLEPIAGLEMEGSEPSSDSAVSDAIEATPAVMEAAVTGAEAAPAPSTKFVGLEEDGEALPRLSDPVVKRPRTVRFRFSNGVLQNVESDKTEPKEELRDPLA